MNLKLTNILNEYAQKVVNNLITKYKVENPNLTDVDIEKIKEEYINRFEELKASPKVVEKDITKYSFQQLKKLVDSFPTKEKVKKQGESNNVEFPQTNLIYNKPPLQIYHGDNERTCIKIKGDFPATWCVARSTGGNLYSGYRYAGTEPSFYFVKNLERLNKITDIEDDKYCFFVVQRNNQGNYIVTSAKNDGDRTMSWDGILKIEPLLQGTENLFKNVPLTDEEREYYRRFKGGISSEEYNDLSYKEKKIYIAITTMLTPIQLENTPNDLINDYITTGVSLTPEQFDFIKDKRQLFNNYRRVTIDNVIPEYIKGNVKFEDRWLALTDDEAVDLYKKLTEGRVTVDILLKNRILRHKPTIFDRIIIDVNTYLDNLDNNQIENHLVRFPILIDKYKDILGELSNVNIEAILRVQPQLVEYFQDKLKDNEILFSILYNKPSNIKYFIEYLNLINSNYMVSLLSAHPQLIGYFEKYLSKMSTKFDIKFLLSKHPQLKPYFEKQGLLKESLKYLSLRNILKR
jgi:hypothetical protein